ncbi:MAG: hypothetical protein V4642_13215 [Bacteroidota bacterium]
MNALEFSTKIEKGMIRLPEQYNKYENTYARIIVLLDVPDDLLSKKKALLTAFKKMEGHDMFSSIDDPTGWQRKVRDEWE